MLPALKREAREELIRIGKERVIEEMVNCFSDKLKYGPYRHIQGNNIESLKEMLRNCPSGRPKNTVCGIFASANSKDPLHISFIDIDGMLRATDTINERDPAGRKERLKLFLYKNQPDMVILNSSGGRYSQSLKALIENSIVLEIAEALELRYKKLDHDDITNMLYRPKVILSLI